MTMFLKYKRIYPHSLIRISWMCKIYGAIVVGHIRWMMIFAWCFMVKEINMWKGALRVLKGHKRQWKQENRYYPTPKALLVLCLRGVSLLEEYLPLVGLNESIRRLGGEQLLGGGAHAIEKWWDGRSERIRKHMGVGCPKEKGRVSYFHK